jgi:nitrogen regulatory protein P-II 2
MRTTQRQLITIIAEAVLERRLLDDLIRLGAKGYSVMHAAGRGTRGLHTTDWEGPNVRIEAIVTDAAAERIVDELATRYFEHFAVVVFTSAVHVARPDKFG